MCHIQHQFPCLDCQPHSYIRMVQHLIEKCLILHMNEDQCVKTLAKHAHIQPLVTTTVWKELLKENEDFFKAYYEAISPPSGISFTPHRVPEEEKDEDDNDDDGDDDDDNDDIRDD